MLKDTWVWKPRWVAGAVQVVGHPSSCGRVLCLIETYRGIDQHLCFANYGDPDYLTNLNTQGFMMFHVGISQASLPLEAYCGACKFNTCRTASRVFGQYQQCSSSNIKDVECLRAFIWAWLPDL